MYVIYVNLISVLVIFKILLNVQYIILTLIFTKATVFNIRGVKTLNIFLALLEVINLLINL